MNVPRVGTGFDVHPFAEGRALVLGGVTIPHPVGLLGHSDADVLTHAVMDALLGAVAMGDIGGMFPNTDARWRGACSLDLLTAVRERLDAAGWRIVNVDVTVLAEAPKLAPHVPAMRVRLAERMAVEADQVSVKATTMEKLGAIGRREGIAATAVALVCRAEAG